MERAVIIGAGQAAAHAALALRDAGWQGPVLLLGTEPHLPYDRPPLSKAWLTETPPPAPVLFVSPEKLAERAIEVRTRTTVTEIDRANARLHLADGGTEPYERLLIATGGQARRLTLPGAERVLTLRTQEDAIAIRARLVPGARVACIGAGVIGLEIAASARTLGAEVTVLEAGDRPMARSLTPDMSAWIAALHERNGVTLRFGARIDAITPDGVQCADTFVPADLVVAGIGITRDDAIARDAGLPTDNGILVDAATRTADPAIHAAGDVAAFAHPLYGRMRLEAWRHAMNHGAAAGRAMAGQDVAYDDIPWFWTDQFTTNLQMAGLADGTHSTILRGDPTAASFAAFHLNADGHVIAVTGINAPRDVRAGQALIPLRKPADPAALANPATNLQKLVAELRK